ncbi:hypothetical protein ACIPZ5_01800 [Pseudomonas sp. NPDC089428]|uniref:hypothetical protein n=1 Tax=Pseudomonas sp. NPDC089428 TaxID=3364467 RepID=UPI0038193879
MASRSQHPWRRWCIHATRHRQSACQRCSRRHAVRRSPAICPHAMRTPCGKLSDASEDLRAF